TLLPTDGRDPIELGETSASTFSPDGKQLFFMQPTDASQNNSPMLAFIMDIATQEITELTLNIETFVWSPDSASFFFVTSEVQADDSKLRNIYEYDLAT